jgi:hypothetical protein
MLKTRNKKAREKIFTNQNFVQTNAQNKFWILFKKGQTTLTAS